MNPPDDKRGLRQALGVWAGAMVALHVLLRLEGTGGFWSEAAGALTAAALIYPPALIGFRQGRPLSYWRLDRYLAARDLKWFAVTVAAVFPAVIVVNHFYQKLFFGAAYVSPQGGLWFSYAVTQLVLVAFPEEFFFRGFLQERFAAAYPPRRRVLGVPFGKAQILTALLFALSHSLIAVRWWHGFIFFPALVFAWLREKTGTIWAAALFHAACNLFSYWAALSYRG